MEVLHITVHLGGGIGKAVADTIESGRLLDKRVKHRILYLESLEQTCYSEKCMQAGAAVIKFKQEEFYRYAAESDIVIFHWWNHPQMNRVLMELNPFDARVVFWVHVSGCHYPYLPFRLTEAADYLLFTTPYAYENPLWDDEEISRIKEKSSVIYGLGKLPAYCQKKKGTGMDTFVTGYIGTVQEAKIHPDYPEFCGEVKRRILQSKFVVAGHNEIGSLWDERLKQQRIEDSFTFAGYVSDIEACFTQFDVFGYLLNPRHYGTTENALLEAMAAGIPVVVMDQNPERYIVDQGKTGFLVKDEQEYGQVMQELYHFPALRRQIGENASRTVREKYRLEENVSRLYRHLRRLCEAPRRETCFQKLLGETPYQWFLSCAGKEGEKLNRLLSENASDRDTVPSVFTGRSKGSLLQYAKVFPEESTFMDLYNLLNKEGGCLYGRK